MTAYTDRFVLVRCPKTGSSYTSTVIRQLGNATGRMPGVEPHCPVWAIPADWKASRETIGTLRNPWDWYRSFHAHMLREEHQDALEAFGGRDFRSFLYGATHGQGPVDMCGMVDVDATGEEFAASGLGLASWMQRHYYGERTPDADSKGWGVDVLIPTEHITEALSSLFDADASKWSPRNVGKYTPTEYDDEMLSWVKEADKRLIYTFRWRYGKPCTKRLLRVG